MKTAAGFNEGSGMIDLLRELAEADPFVPFTIRMTNKKDYLITKREHIQFTHYGAPKIFAGTNKGFEHFELARWRVLNVDAIGEITL